MSKSRGMLGAAAVLAWLAWGSHPETLSRSTQKASPCVDPYGQPCQTSIPTPPPPRGNRS